MTLPLGSAALASNVIPVCVVRNDGPEALLPTAVLDVSEVDLASGTETPLIEGAPVALGAGPGAVRYFALPALRNASAVLRAVVSNRGGAVLYDNVLYLAAPAAWATALSAVSVTAAVADASNADGSVNVTVAAAGGGGPALFVTLTTLSEGRFSDNALPLLAVGAPRLLSFSCFDAAAECSRELLRDSLRVEHLALYWGASPLADMDAP